MKNKNKNIVALIMLLVFPALSYAQDYASMPPAIQAKMDQNKIQGADLLTGIEAVYSITVANISSANAQALTNLLSADDKISGFTISPDYSNMQVTCKASVQIEELKKHIGDVNGEINQYTQLYRLEN